MLTALSDTSKWPAFKALSYLHDTRSIYNGVILDYVTCEERGVTVELLEAVYTSLDNDMRATMELEGPEYVADNERVWKMLKPLVVEGPCGLTFVHGIKCTSVAMHGWRW